jgi:hypothetical protein
MRMLVFLLPCLLLGFNVLLRHLFALHGRCSIDIGRKEVIVVVVVVAVDMFVIVVTAVLLLLSLLFLLVLR